MCTRTIDRHLKYLLCNIKKDINSDRSLFLLYKIFNSNRQLLCKRKLVNYYLLCILLLYMYKVFIFYICTCALVNLSAHMLEAQD